ncbi:MAG: hypothetical protein A7315_04640 [Candidatus Altiarchaeales archaeon WOR_SM1_79]|nr:MAG: hypothetical protein A7315_04640 [Candidatus Altiarchaeales archaeon WOR_SM1_79]
MELEFRICLESDYHSSAGYGKGTIDSILLKDKDTPVIRGSVLAGLLRQKMRELLQLDLLEAHRGCEQSGGGGDRYCSEDKVMCPMCKILGTREMRKKWRISTAKMDHSSEKVVWRNRVDPKTRRAEERKLFSEEVGGKGAGFVFTASSDNGTKEEASFIVAAFRMVRNLGSSRRRGKGRCNIHLTNKKEEDNLLKTFEERWLENKYIEEKYSGVKVNKVDDLRKKKFTIILLTNEPVIIAERAESGNRYRSNNYIPGYTILGAMAWKVARRCDLGDNAVYKKFIELFRRGGIKVSALYPAWQSRNDIYPTIHSPEDFLTCKDHPAFEDDGHEIKGFATQEKEPEKCEECEGVDTPLNSMSKFLVLCEEQDKKLRSVDVVMREEMHIGIELKTGRVKEEMLFSYMCIDSGQYFVGDMEINDWINFAKMVGMKDNKLELQIGKSSTRGYGSIKIRLQDPQDIFIGRTLEERVTDSTITMTFLTDTILADKWGRFISKIDEGYLKELLGVDVKILSQYVKSKNVDGFNAHLGLPKWRDCAIVAGSSVGFEVKSDMEISKMKELERDGVGLRQEEGFGRVAFNHPIYDKNKNVNTSIRLSEDMRIPIEYNALKNFEKWWKRKLDEKLKREDFTASRWMSVCRWIRSKKTIKDFHTPDILKLIKEREVSKDKEKFLDKEGKIVQKLLSLEEELSKRLQKEDEKINDHLQVKAIEILADFIASKNKNG